MAQQPCSSRTSSSTPTPGGQKLVGRVYLHTPQQIHCVFLDWVLHGSSFGIWLLEGWSHVPFAMLYILGPLFASPTSLLLSDNVTSVERLSEEERYSPRGGGDERQLQLLFLGGGYSEEARQLAWMACTCYLVPSRQIKMRRQFLFIPLQKKIEPRPGIAS
jgi:hypothetical protein